MRRFIPTIVLVAGIVAVVAGSAQAAQPTVIQLCANIPDNGLACRIDPSKPIVHIKGTTTACTDTNGQRPYVCDTGSAEHPIWDRAGKLHVLIDCVNYDQVISVVGKAKTGTYDHVFKKVQPAITAELKAGDSCTVVITPIAPPAARSSSELPWLHYGPGNTKK